MKESEKFAAIWDFYKPRHTHAWNMLVISFDELRRRKPVETSFETEYAWENVILRLWLYRIVVRTLTRLPPVADDAHQVIHSFDQTFDHDGANGLKALRDMIEHFDDYAANHGRGPANTETDVDPWRTITPDEYRRGQFSLSREISLVAADQLRFETKLVSDQFIEWYKSQ